MNKDSVKLKQNSEMLDQILCNLKLSRQEHELVYQAFNFIIDLAQVGVKTRESDAEIARLVKEEVKLSK